MATLEVPEKQWEQFCDRVHEFSQGALMTIQVVDADGTMNTVGQDLVLVSLVLDKQSDACSNNLVIEAGRPGEKSMRHVILEPIHILLRDGADGGSYRHMQVMAENGTTTMAFHPGLHPELLKGLGE